MGKVIHLDHLTKIEGHARLHIKIDKNEIKDVSLNIFEGSRFFEGILKNKSYQNISPIASRICGICSVVHGLTSMRAVESAFNIKTSRQTELLRELMQIAGIMQSHVLHLYFMVLPDYLKYENALQMAKNHKKKIETALKIKKAGNEIVKTIGGRDVHPFTSVVGGFSRIPEERNLILLKKYLKSIKNDAKDTLQLFSSLKYPKFEHEKEYFALHSKRYFYGGKDIACKGKVCTPIESYEEHFKEYFKPGSTSEFVKERGKSYMVGAMARILNNKKLLSKDSKRYISMIERNKLSPFMNNIAQSIEIYEGILRCLEILDQIKLKKESLPKLKIKAAKGIAALEAPRGILFHKYSFDKKGFCKSCNITTPTSQNLQNMEDAVKAYLPSLLNKDKETIILEIEKLIRSYDPCISCSTHFLDVVWD